MKKLLALFVLTFTFISTFSAQVLNDAQIIKTGHWVYEDLDKLTREQRISVFNDNSMMSVAELKFCLNQVDYDKLSESGKNAYLRVYEFLNTNRNLVTEMNKLFKTEVLDDSALRLDINIILNPELYYKSNPDIDWSFNYYFIDNIGTAPIRFGFMNNLAIENDVFVGKSHLAAQEPGAFTNLPYRGSDDFEFLFNKFAYGSVGKAFDKWGFNISLGKQGYSIGNTNMESVYYSDKFETDAYFLLNVYSKSLKYSLDVTQVDYSKYLYLHQLELIAFKNIKFSIMEGSQVVGPFQLRFLNPFLFMHQMSGWNDYDEDGNPYAEEKFCAYFGYLLETTIIKNTRIYVLYAQNEIQSKAERTGNGRFYPDSYAYQAGFETSIPSKYDGYWNFGLEGVYTSPYMYIKHTPEASLYRLRQDNLSSDDIKTWLGSPFGPDNISFKADFGFSKNSKWKANLGYLFSMKGEIDTQIFDIKKKYADGTNPEEEYYAYYPPVVHNLGLGDDDELISEALNMMPSGIVQYTNRIILNGEYILNSHLKFNAQGIYSFVFNNNNIMDKNEQGIELSISMTYNLFK